MSKIVFKQWIYAPNKTNTVKAVSGMINYIATRPGVDYNEIPFDEELEKIHKDKFVEYIAYRPGVAKAENMAHGLFGKVSGMSEQADIPDLLSAQQYIRQKAKEHTTIYNAVISLNEEDAISKDITDRKAFEELLKNNILDIARGMNISVSNLEYYAAVHLEAGHPHLHLMYWDREQKIGVNFIKPERSDQIRKKLVSNIFGDELKEVMNEKDKHRKNILQAANNIFSGESIEDIFKSSQKYQAPYKLLNRRSSAIDDISNSIIAIYNTISADYKKGALKYDYMPEHIKEQLFELSSLILKGSPDIAKEYNSYIKACKTQAEFYGGEENIKEYVKAMDNSIKKNLSNKILGVVKEMKKQSFELKREAIQKNIARNRTVNLLQSVLNAFVVTNHNINNKGSTSRKNYKEMNAIERAELKRKQQDSHSIEWGE